MTTVALILSVAASLWIKEIYLSPIGAYAEERTGHELLFLDNPYYACGQLMEINSSGECCIILDYRENNGCWEYMVQINTND